MVNIGSVEIKYCGLYVDVIVVVFAVVFVVVVYVVVIVVVNPRNLPLKFGQSWVSNSWDIPDIEFVVSVWVVVVVVIVVCIAIFVSNKT